MIDFDSNGVFRFVGKFVKEFLWDLIFIRVCYVVGWIVLRILSLGRSPGDSLREGLSDGGREDNWVSIFGAIFLIGIYMKFFFLRS